MKSILGPVLVIASLALPLTRVAGDTLAVLSSSASPYLDTAVGFPPAITLPKDGGDGVTNVGGGTLQTANTGTRVHNAVFVFQLPNLGAVSNPFTDASFTVTIGGISGPQEAFGYNPGGNNYDAYVLGRRDSADVLASDFYAGGDLDSTDATRIAVSIAGVDYSYSIYSVGTAKTTGVSSTLTSSLNAAYADGAGAGKYVFIRINPNWNANSYSNIAWNTDSTTFISYTASVPVPTDFRITDTQLNAEKTAILITLDGLVVGKEYLLQSSPDLGVFSNLEPTRFTATASSQIITQPVSPAITTKQFFRVADVP